VKAKRGKLARPAFQKRPFPSRDRKEALAQGPEPEPLERVRDGAGVEGRGETNGFRPASGAGRRDEVAEARKGIALHPDDRTAKPSVVRGAGGAGRRNQKARAFPRKRQAVRSVATGGRQQCRPPFCVRRAPGVERTGRALRGQNLLLPKNNPARAGRLVSGARLRPASTSTVRVEPFDCLLRQALRTGFGSMGRSRDTFGPRADPSTALGMNGGLGFPLQALARIALA